MAFLTIPDTELKRLAEVAPAFLQGDRADTRRVLWAIDETVKRFVPEQDEAGDNGATGESKA